MRYKYFEDLEVLAEAEYNNQKMTVEQIFMKEKMNGKTLFNGIEQRYGKYTIRL